MNSIYNFIITTGNRYNNSVDVEGKELIINTEITERDAEYVNRVGTVIGTPLAIETPVETGDEVIVHHNVFRRWYDIRGKEKNGGSFISEDTYRVAMDQVFAYRKPNGEWLSTPGYVFVKPIKERADVWDTSAELNLMGNVVIGHEDIGCDRGALVGFKPDSEYPFYINDELMYRIYLNDIVWTTEKNVKELLNQHNLHLAS